MTEEHTPPDVDEPVEVPTPDSAIASETGESDAGIGFGAGILGGAVVGVLGAVVAAVWFGYQEPAVPDGANTDAASSPASSRPFEPVLERPASGTDILPPARTGGGSLILENTGGLDAVVVLADEATYTRAVYVRSGDRVTVPDVAAGSYEILMLLGLGWNATRFTQAATYQQLDQAIEFTERDLGPSTEYTRLTISIEPVTADMAGVSQVAPFQLLAP